MVIEKSEQQEENDKSDNEESGESKYIFIVKYSWPLLFKLKWNICLLGSK